MHQKNEKKLNQNTDEAFKETMETLVMIKVSLVLGPLWNN